MVKKFIFIFRTFILLIKTFLHSSSLNHHVFSLCSVSRDYDHLKWFI